jgi:hypothetical protein
MKNFINKHKKRIALGLIAISLLCLATTSTPENLAYASTNDNSVRVLINGKPLGSESPAYIVNNRTMIPLRAVSEKFGAEVKWNEENRTVDIFKDNKTVRLYINNRLVRYSEDNILGNSSFQYDVSDVSPIIINNHTYLPLRLISNALGLDASWNEIKREVRVTLSDTAKTENYFNIKISSISDNQVISDVTSLTLSGTESLPANAAQLRYLFLDPITGKGKILAKTDKIKESVTLRPDINNQGNGVLAAVIYDKNGNFLAGATKEITIQLNPKIALKGISANQSLSSAVSLSSDINFIAAYVKYEILYANKETPVFISDAEIDPDGNFTYSPKISENGAASIRVTAYDVNDKPFVSSDYVNINVAVQPAKPLPPYVSLSSITTNNVGIVPVKLSISRNFDVSKTQYYAKNVSTGKTVLLHEVGFGDHNWFPGPDMAGTWDIFVTCIRPNGEALTSNTRRVTVPDKESLIISGIGPNQVINGLFSISSTANVPIKEVSYIISNPYNKTQAVLGTAADTTKLISYTPQKVNEGIRNIQAIATTADGKTLKSEIIEVKFHMGELYKAQPIKINGKIITPEEFIKYVSPMALQNQKQNGMSAALKVAQAILETGWGKSIPVDRYSGLFSNNFFGIKGTGNAGSVLIGTREEYYGTLYYVDDYFRAYNSIQDSLNDHTALLTEKERYIPYKDVMHNSTAAAHALKRCGYATDSGYASKLIYLIQRWGLDELDKQGI